jgi:DNA polymerase III epsilon subunit-like protein
MKIAFIDTETTGLDPLIHEPWEVAVILRTPAGDAERVWRIEPDLSTADAQALEINRYRERTSAPEWRWDDRKTAIEEMYGALTGAVLVGSNPPFDAGMLASLFGAHYMNPTPWPYRVLDVATLAAGYRYGLGARLATTPRRVLLGAGQQASTLALEDAPDAALTVHGATPWPWSLTDCAADAGLPGVTEWDPHTALGDARWARDLWDRLVAPATTEVTADDAAHVLWHFGHLAGAKQPGSGTENLIRAIATADLAGRSRLASVYPGLALAVHMATREPDGVDQLRAIARSGR